jgi:ABC-type multidrug transport system fused ATPase/permease subunit
MLQEEFRKAEELAIHIKNYIQTEIEIIKLNFAEKVSKILSNFLAIIILIWVLLLSILFASISLAFFIGERLGKMSIGFLVVSLIYLLIAMVSWYLRERLIRIPILNGILRQLFDNENKAEEK